MGEPIIVRDARYADAPKLTDFNVRMARETEDKRLDPAVVTAGVGAVLDEPARGFYLVAELGATVVGALMVTKEWSDWRNGDIWWIQSVYVEPAFRRRGVFQALFETVRQRSGATPRVCGLRLYVERDNLGAQSTYARLGMVETHYKVFEQLAE